MNKNKILTFMITLVFMCTLITGCGKDPAAKELEKFANRDMTKINVTYSKFVKDYQKVTGMTDSKAQIQMLEDVILVELSDIKKQVAKIELKEKEIIKLKDMYAESIQGYIDGIENCKKALKKKDNKALQEANQQVLKVADKLNAYNSYFNELAKKYNMKVLDTKTNAN